MKYMIPRHIYMCKNIMLFSLVFKKKLSSQIKWHAQWDPILLPSLLHPNGRQIFYDGSVIQLCIYRMLDACNLLKLEGCVSTRKQLHMYYITARMMPLPITCMMENLNKKSCHEFSPMVLHMCWLKRRRRNVTHK
jgi:hypothetical protein